MVNILIVDDHSLMRRAVREVVEKEADIKVVAEACNGQEAELQATQTQPDVVLMDVDMPDCSGFDATERVLACSPHSQSHNFHLISSRTTTVSGDPKGAIGYITKDIEPDALIHAIHCAARNDLCIPGAFAAQVLAYLRSYWKVSTPYSSLISAAVSYRTSRRAARAIAGEGALLLDASSNLPRPLTEREKQILDLMRKGRKNREIAIELSIAESTVHKHVQNIFEKLHARNRTEAIYLTSAEG